MMAISIMVKDGGYDSLNFVVNTITLDKKEDFTKLIIKIVSNMFSLKDEKKIISWGNETLIHNRFRVAFARALCKSYLDTMRYTDSPDFMFDINEPFRWYVNSKSHRDGRYTNLLCVTFKDNTQLNEGGIIFDFDRMGLIRCNISQ